MFISNFTTDIDECVATPGKCHNKTACNNTHGRTCARANLDISEMGAIVQVPSIVLKVFRFLLTSISSFLHVRQSRVENRHGLQSLTR